MTSSSLSRRTFLSFASAAMGSLVLPRKAWACGFAVDCQSTTDTTVTLTVSSLANCGTNTPNQIRVQYQPAPAGDWNSPAVSTTVFAADLTGGSANVTINDLECDITYVFRVRLEIVETGMFTDYVEVTGCDLECQTTPSGCTYTQGYWKNHPNAWPVDSLVLGTSGRSYTKTQLIAILNTPVRGNGLISLARQLIAAKLNVANGSTCPAAAQAIASADALIGSLVVGTDSLSSSVTSAVATTLDQFNNGLLEGCATHCAG